MPELLGARERAAAGARSSCRRRSADARARAGPARPLLSAAVERRVRPRPRRPRRSRRGSPPSSRPGDVVTVSGELGAGKTTFVRGACRALGVDGPVTSPTFTIGHRYDGARRRRRTSTSTGSEASRRRSGATSSRTSTDAIVLRRVAGGRRRLRCRRRASGVAAASTLDETTRRMIAGSQSMLILAFDTATRRRDVRARARTARCSASARGAPCALLADADELLREAALEPRDLDALVVGTGPGQLHGPPHRARDGARRSRSRSTSRSPASRRSTRSPPARRARCR